MNKELITKAKNIAKLTKDLEEFENMRDILELDNYTVCLSKTLYIDQEQTEVVPIKFCKEAVMEQLNNKIISIVIKLEEELQ